MYAGGQAKVGPIELWLRVPHRMGIKKRGRSPSWVLPTTGGLDQVASVQVPESLSQVVALSPGSRGPKVVWPVIVVTGAVGVLQALAFGVGADMPGVMLAATAELM